MAKPNDQKQKNRCTKTNKQTIDIRKFGYLHIKSEYYDWETHNKTKRKRVLITQKMNKIFEEMSKLSNIIN